MHCTTLNFLQGVAVGAVEELTVEAEVDELLVEGFVVVEELTVEAEVNELLVEGFAVVEELDDDADPGRH